MLVLIRAVFARNINVSRMSIGGLLIVAMWGAFSMSAVPLHCPAELAIPKRGQDHCVDFVSLHMQRLLCIHILTSQIPWLQAVTVGDIITEIIITSLPMLGLYNTQLPLKSKAAVMLAFSTRIPYVNCMTPHSSSHTDH